MLKLRDAGVILHRNWYGAVGDRQAFSEYVQNTNSVIAYRRTGMCFGGVTCRGRSAGDAGGRPVCLRGMMNLDRHRCRPLCFQPRQSLIR